MTDSAPEDNADLESAGVLPQRRVTINQLIGYNVTWFRRAAGLTQEELGKRLGGWSGASVSAAERSWEGKRVRKFDADELVKIAAALGVPVLALLLPPSDAGTAIDYSFDFGDDAAGLAELLAHVAPSYGLENSAMAAFRERLIALGVSRSRYGYDPVADATAESILDRVRVQAEQVTGDARGLAEALERHAQQRHREVLGSLLESREELVKRINDLRMFEREYRSRLLAFMEAQVRELKVDHDMPPFGQRDEDKP